MVFEGLFTKFAVGLWLKNQNDFTQLVRYLLDD